jgi:argininosuccinate lyase
MWAPDMALDLVHVCVQVMTSLDRLAEELQLWTTEAFGFAEIGDDQSRASVVMPHKKNPNALTYVRGAARQALGRATGVVASQLTASGQPDNRTLAYLDVPVLLADTVGAVTLMTAVLDGTRFDVGAMRAAAAAGFSTSTEICDHLALVGGLDNRTAHSLVGRAVRAAVDAGRDRLTFDDLSGAAADVGVTLAIDADGLERLLDPAETIASRVTPGGAGADQVAAMIAELEAAASAWHRHFSGHPSHGYRERLVARASSVVAGHPNQRKDVDPS